MKELVLHIGSTKTGSSAIQHFMWDNRRAIESLGILYPEVGIAGVAHHILGAAVHPSAWRMHGAEFAKRDRPQYFNELVEGIGKAGEASSASRLLVSTEYLWGQFNETVFASMESLFRSFHVRLICYIRRQDGWLESTYAQSIKSGETRTFREWLLRYLDQGLGFCHYDRILRQWERYLPPDRIHVRLYEPDDNFTDSITDFLEFLGIRGQASLKVPSGDSNPSPTPIETEVIRLVNLSDLSPEQKQKLRHTLLRSSEKKHRYDSFHYLSADETIQLLKRYETGNAAVAKKYLKIESGSPFKRPLPNPGEWQSWEGPTADEAVSRIVRGIAGLIPA
jgi:capsular polysaccharide export protein